MPFPSLTFAHLLDNATAAELQQLVSLIQGYLSAQHKADGSHSAITGDSLSVTGQITADSDGLLPVTIGRLGTGTSSGGLGDAGVNLGGKWYLRARASSSPGGGADYELQVWDLTNDATVPALRLVWQTDGWRLMHGSTSSKTLKLGSSSTRWDEINVLTANVITALNLLGNAVGTINAVTFAAGNFTAASGTWTVASGDVLTNRYTVTGNHVTWTVFFNTTSVSATPTYLKVTLPNSWTVDKDTVVPILISDNGGAVQTGVAYAVSGDTFVRFYPNVDLTTLWSVATNTTSVRGTFSVFVS